MGDGAIFLLLFILVLAVYWLLTHQIFLVSAWRFMRIGELYVLSWLPGWLPLVNHKQILTGLHFLETHQASQIPLSLMPKFDAFFAKRYSWIPGAILVYLGVRKMMKGTDVTTSYDMETLLKRNAPIFQKMRAALGAHPEKMDIDLDVEDAQSLRFAPPVSPTEFAQMKPPIGLEKEAEKNELYNKPIWDGGSDIDWDLAEKAFSKQLGSPYSGIEAMSEQERFVYDRLIGQIEMSERDMNDLVEKCVEIELSKHFKVELTEDQSAFVKESNKPTRKLFSIVSEIARERIRKDGAKKAAGGDKNEIRQMKRKLFSLKSVKEIGRMPESKKLGKSILAESIMERHGFTRVGLISLLEEARKSGVISSGEFDDIKTEDRTLWHCLDSAGRKTPEAEAAGVYAHWGAEKRLRRPLFRPEVYMAIEGLVSAIGLNN